MHKDFPNVATHFFEFENIHSSIIVIDLLDPRHTNPLICGQRLAKKDWDQATSTFGEFHLKAGSSLHLRMSDCLNFSKLQWTIHKAQKRIVAVHSCRALLNIEGEMTGEKATCRIILFIETLQSLSHISFPEMYCVFDQY